MKDPQPFVEYSKNMQDVYKNIEECNTSRQCNVLIVFDDMIADMLSNKTFNPIVTESIVSGRKLNISLALTTKSYFSMSKILD